jgi:hypothetical protein
MGQKARTGYPGRLPGLSQPPSLLKQGLKAESGPEECPEGGKELGGQPLGGLEMPAFGRFQAWVSQGAMAPPTCLFPHTHPSPDLCRPALAFWLGKLDYPSLSFPSWVCTLF